MKIYLVGGPLLLLLLVFDHNILYLTDGAVIFESLVPDNSSCFAPGDFGCLCLSTNDCNANKSLECIDYKCYCMNPMHRLYDNKLQNCVGLVGSKCSEERRSVVPKCVKNSECEVGRCVCREGYSVTSKKMCMINYAEPCGPFQCNIDRGLACKSGTCQCLDSSFVYSAVTRKCFDPETFLTDVLNWLSQGFIRDTVLHKTLRFVLKALQPLTNPLKSLRNGIFG